MVGLTRAWLVAGCCLALGCGDGVKICTADYQRQPFSVHVRYQGAPEGLCRAETQVLVTAFASGETVEYEARGDSYLGCGYGLPSSEPGLYEDGPSAVVVRDPAYAIWFDNDVQPVRHHCEPSWEPMQVSVTLVRE